MLAALVCCVSLPGVSKARFDFFALNAKESSQVCAYVMCEGPVQHENLRQALTAAESVATVDSFAPQPASDDPLKRRAIVKIGTLLEQLSQPANAAIANRWASVEAEAGQTFAQLQRSNVPQELLTRWNLAYHHLETSIATTTDSTLPQWLSLLPFLNPAAPQWNELSPELISRSVGRQGKTLLRVTPREPTSQRIALQRFVAEIERIAPSATGPAVNQWHVARTLQTAYLQAALYTLFTAAMMQLLTLHSIARACLSMAPSVLGLASMFALAGWCDVSLTATSCLAWPAVLALGTCHGVLLTRSSMTNSLTLAITLSAGLTLLASVPLLLSPHAELSELGRLLMFGGVGSWSAAIFIVPVFLREQVSVTPVTVPTPVPEPSVLLSVEATPVLVRPHRRLIQPTRKQSLRA